MGMPWNFINFQMEKLGQINNNEYKSIVQRLWGQRTRRANKILVKEKEKVMWKCSIFTEEREKKNCFSALWREEETTENDAQKAEVVQL